MVTMLYTLNANFGPDFAGPVRGTWSLHVDGGGLWEGTWNGRGYLSTNSILCYGSPSCWVGELKLVGNGRSKNLRGLQVEAAEVIRTFTPLPASYENVCEFDPSACLLKSIPEGFVRGRILEPGKHD